MVMLMPALIEMQRLFSMCTMNDMVSVSHCVWLKIEMVSVHIFRVKM